MRVVGICCSAFESPMSHSLKMAEMLINTVFLSFLLVVGSSAK